MGRAAHGSTHPSALLILHGLYVAAGALLLGVAPAFGEWSVQTGAAVSYTTNIFQFSSASRLSIQEDPSQPIPVRDVLSKPSDVIWQPSVRVGRSWSSRLGTSEVSFKTEGALYTQNPSFDNAYYRLAYRQSLNPRRRRFSSSTGIRPINCSGRAESRPSRTNIMVRCARLRTSGAQSCSGQITDRWAATLISRYGLRLYQEPFTERDTHLGVSARRLSLRCDSGQRSPWPICMNVDLPRDVTTPKRTSTCRISCTMRRSACETTVAESWIYLPVQRVYQ